MNTNFRSEREKKCFKLARPEPEQIVFIAAQNVINHNDVGANKIIYM